MKTALLATAATATNSSLRVVPLMHMQGNFNRFTIKVAPGGSLQGFPTPYIQDLISIEPCTLWGKFLSGEREGYAFSGTQARACREQQPGALSSKRALQPLLTTGLEQEAAFQPGIHMAIASLLPFDEVTFTEDMMISAAWSVQNNAPEEQRRPFTQVLQRLDRRLQPLQKQLEMSAVPHQHHLADISVALVITIMYLSKWQYNMLPTTLLQDHNLVSTIAGVPGKLQEEKPLMTREGLRDSNHRQNLNKVFREAKMDKHADFLLPSCLEKQRGGRPRRCCRNRKPMQRSSMMVPTPASSIEQASGN